MSCDCAVWKGAAMTEGRRADALQADLSAVHEALGVGPLSGSASQGYRSLLPSYIRDLRERAELGVLAQEDAKRLREELTREQRRREGVTAERDRSRKEVDLFEAAFIKACEVVGRLRVKLREVEAWSARVSDGQRQWLAGYIEQKRRADALAGGNRKLGEDLEAERHGRQLFAARARNVLARASSFIPCFYCGGGLLGHHDACLLRSLLADPDGLAAEAWHREAVEAARKDAFGEGCKRTEEGYIGWVAPHVITEAKAEAREACAMLLDGFAEECDRTRKNSEVAAAYRYGASAIRRLA